MDPSTLKEMRAARRQSIPRTVKAARPEAACPEAARPEAVEDVVMAPEQKEEEPPAQTEETIAESSKPALETLPNEEQISSEDTKENEQDNGVLTPTRPKLKEVDNDNSDNDSYKSPAQTTSLCN